VSGDSTFAAIYVLEQNKSLQKDGGFPEVTITKGGSDETRLVKSARSYYLDISASTSWSVTVEELK
jgi:hypothetical protein